MAGSSSSCPSDSEETKIITTSISKRDTVTRRHEDQAVPPPANVKQGATSRDVKKRTFANFFSFISDANNPIGYATTTIHTFINDSIRLVRRCNKPDRQEFQKIAYACSIGFFLMGFIGYFVKLFFIPINNIIVSK